MDFKARRLLSTMTRALVALFATVISMRTIATQSVDKFRDEILKLKGDYLALYRDVILNKHYNSYQGILDGSDWPPGGNSVSMAGARRIDHFSSAIAQAITDKIPGHVIETGVWRGGSSFMAAKTIELLGESDSRLVYLCDSFRGIPKVEKPKCKYAHMTLHWLPSANPDRFQNPLTQQY
jgi:Macrocin-O-methyltransferase (TylF)